MSESYCYYNMILIPYVNIIRTHGNLSSQSLEETLQKGAEIISKTHILKSPSNYGKIHIKGKEEPHDLH